MRKQFPNNRPSYIESGNSRSELGLGNLGRRHSPTRISMPSVMILIVNERTGQPLQMNASISHPIEHRVTGQPLQKNSFPNYPIPNAPKFSVTLFNSYTVSDGLSSPNQDVTNTDSIQQNQPNQSDPKPG